MKALSLQEPYAWLILQRAYEDNPDVPLKPIDNRSWPLPKDFKLPQRIYVHASLTMYDVELHELKELMTATQWLRNLRALRSIYSLWESYHGQPAQLRKFSYFGHILGEITITGQVTQNDSPWFFGPYGFTLVRPQLYDRPVLCKGALKFFDPRPEETVGSLIGAFSK